MIEIVAQLGRGGIVQLCSLLLPLLLCWSRGQREKTGCQSLAQYQRAALRTREALLPLFALQLDHRARVPEDCCGSRAIHLGARRGATVCATSIAQNCFPASVK